MAGRLNPQNTAPFQYRPLSIEQREIRLIEIEPLQDSPDPTSQPLVQCRLRHASLAKPPVYTALSYTWGDLGATRDILLDDRRIKVTETLESALRGLAVGLWNGAGLGRTLWADAVCIDQRNETERTRQVVQMGAIFRAASKTLIHLGPEGRDSDLAIATLRGLDRVAGPIFRRFPSWADVPFADRPRDPVVAAIQGDLDGVLSRDFPEGDPRRLAAVRALFDRPWFRRVWVIQERVLSTDAFVCCGGTWIRWKAFFYGFWLLCGIRDYLNLVGSRVRREDSAALAAVLTAALDKVTPVAFTRANSSLFAVFSLLCRMAPRSQLRASDRRDYVFALLGLVDAEKSPRIVPDYGKDWAVVRTEVARACLAYYGLGMLSFAGLCDERPERRTPSWAPDWSSEYLPQPLVVSPSSVVRGGNSGSTYSASAGDAQDLSGGFASDRGLLLRALRVDDVARLGEPLSEADDVADDAARIASLATWMGGLEGLLPRPNDIYQTADAVREALWRTPVADRAYAHSWETGRASDQTLAAYEALREGNVARGARYASIADVKLYRRRPFSSAKGYIGLGPVGMSTGDSIWVIRGANVPFVLRQESTGGFLVVGEAYVHGIMDGEFIRWQTKPYQMIELV